VTLAWQDLLGVPFLLGGDDPAVGLDCWGQARVIRARLGREIQALPTREGDCLPLCALTCVGQRPTRSSEVGDLIFGDPEGKGYPSHVSIVVEPGRALTTTIRHGPLSISVRAAACEYGVWR